MIVNTIEELSLYPVEKRGIPNGERIPIYVKETLNIGCYGIMVGSKGVDNTVNPFQDNLFWFGDAVLNKGDWIMLYTGKGDPKADDWKEYPGAKIYSIHWGRSSTMFANTSIVPVLFKVDAVNVGIGPIDVPQLGN